MIAFFFLSIPVSLDNSWHKAHFHFTVCGDKKTGFITREFLFCFLLEDCRRKSFSATSRVEDNIKVVMFKY